MAAKSRLNLYDSMIVYGHGIAFKVRKVSGSHHHGGSYVIFRPDGRYLVRTPASMIKKYVNHYGLQILRNA